MNNSIWLEENEAIIRKKGQGGSLMVSDLVFPCHGSLKLDENLTKELGLHVDASGIIESGKNADGYWKGDYKVRQRTKKALPIFEGLHLRYTGDFF
ncbi:hypothetical protein GcM1_242101 [Golovinomyces cichoracearum]|uniref:Uncharacterized protein n=1 Tax=Golovinomyces cichoracearum TaxID=62708 RepID=A0A420IH35_9PEZI|nr:hypothetical protein GcM1_242101 [Golovinomyces cichoracearum]